VERVKKAVSVGAGVGVSAGLGSAALVLTGVADPASILNFLSTVASSQIAQAGFFFTVAAWIHSGRVKTEISKHFSSITDAINNVATALREDLQKHGERLDKIDKRVENLEIKINKGDASA